MPSYVDKISSVQGSSKAGHAVVLMSQKNYQNCYVVLKGIITIYAYYLSQHKSISVLKTRTEMAKLRLTALGN